MGPLIYIVLLGGFLAISAGQDESTTPMASKPMQPPQSAPDLIFNIVPVISSLFGAALVIVVIILYLRLCHRTGGDRIVDAEKGKNTESKTSGFELRANATTDREAETVLNGAKDQLREIQSLSKNLALSVKEFKSLEWHAKSILKFIEEGIYEENEPKTLKDELFAEVNKRVAKDPKDHSDDDDDGTQQKTKKESESERQNRLYTETNKVLNDGKKFIKEANQRDIEIRNFTKDAKKALVEVKERVRAMKKPDAKKGHGKFGGGEEGKPLLK